MLNIARIHYSLFMAGTSAISMMMTLFLTHYSDARPSEIGELLMCLPFLSFITKPAYCSIADRYQAHRRFFIAALIVFLLGYGSFGILPFFPDFVANNGRQCWYILIVLTIIGSSAYGCAGSIGDAISINWCHRRGMSFGSVRSWGSTSWGIFGLIIGSLNGGIPGFLPPLVPGFTVLTIAITTEILIVSLWRNDEDFILGELPNSKSGNNNLESKQSEFDLGIPISALTPRGSIAGRPSICGPICDFNEVEKLAEDQRSRKQSTQIPTTDTEVGRQSSVVPRTTNAPDNGSMIKSDQKAKSISFKTQWLIFRMIVMRNKSFFKYFFIFILFGSMFAIHLIYFFLHLEIIARPYGLFSLLSAGCILGQALGAGVSFFWAKKITDRIGHTLGICLSMGIIIFRFWFNGWILPNITPYAAVAMDLWDGLAFGISYTIVSQVGLHFAMKAGPLIPELKERGLIDADADEDALKSSVQATMQGVFGGAFDGLGDGTGALLGGLILEHHAPDYLWRLCAKVSLIGTLVFLVLDILVKAAKKYRNSKDDC
ncbi:hypothetical protein GZH46_00070 [Fragariocoptes setiger]|uniref:Major facilitator superfamily associated domain-containing protein n=1 Tax=Fragariocoptes setiger TaxID=1670756 RepID=A0ABQ7SD66_9ACAR|nr:hypothetical protein GZH46_00070 [Fragariocoptes setiger]